MYFVLQRYALKSDCMLQKHYYLHREWIKMCGKTSCDALLCVVAQVTFCSCPTTDGELPNYRRRVAQLQTASCPTTDGELPDYRRQVARLLAGICRLRTAGCPTACRYLADCTRILARVQVCIRASTGGGIGAKEETPVRAAESLPRTTATGSRGDADSGWSRR